MQTKWDMVVDLTHTTLWEGELVEKAAWQEVVLILKGGCDYRGIGFVEVTGKAVEAILNRSFTASITYHNYRHRFQAGWGTGTTTIEVKLIQKVSALREAVLHAIFLDLNKAYNALDRSICLGILE